MAVPVGVPASFTEAVADPLGELLGRVAASVNTMAEGIHANRHATQACTEVDQCIDRLHALVVQKAGEPAARRLTFWLKNASSVSASYKADIGKLIVSEIEPNRWSAVRRSEHSHQVQQVAGTLRAVGSLVRLQPA